VCIYNSITVRVDSTPFSFFAQPDMWPNAYFLLYLNKKTFLDEGGETARLVRLALQRGVRVVLAHETEPEQVLEYIYIHISIYLYIYLSIYLSTYIYMCIHILDIDMYMRGVRVVLAH